MGTQNNTQVILSDRTRLFIDALNAISDAEDKLIEAMTETYGEEQGDSMVRSLPFDEIRNRISQCMAIVICENQRDDKNLI